MYKNIWKIKNIINENKINIVHTRSRAPAWTVYYAKKNKKIKLVSTFHNVYNSTNLVKKFYNSGLGRADSIIAISNFVKNKIINLYNIPEKKITVIYRGIDQKQFDIKTINEELFVKFIRNNNISDYKKIILYPARLTAWKGQIEFLKVLKKLDHKKYFSWNWIARKCTSIIKTSWFINFYHRRRSAASTCFYCECICYFFPLFSSSFSS